MNVSVKGETHGRFAIACKTPAMPLMPTLIIAAVAGGKSSLVNWSKLFSTAGTHEVATNFGQQCVDTTRVFGLSHRATVQEHLNECN
jgi:hypothetical protein